MKNNEYIIEIENLDIKYIEENRQTSVYKNFDLKISNNETITILGESGSGKSTLANFLIGILPTTAKISSGNYIFDKKDIFKNKKFMDVNKIRGSKVAFIFQDAQQSLNPITKIYKQFEELLLFHNICDKSQVKKLAKEKLDSIRISDSDKVLNSYPFQLSGGMCQRVCIAMCLCLEPKLLIADEPTSALDVLSGAEVINNLNELDNIAKLVITHDISIAARCSDKIIVLKDGDIYDQGSVDYILNNSKLEYTRNLVDAYKNILNIKKPDLSQKTKILEVKNIEKSYGNHKVVDGVSFDIYKEEIFGIIGESGCGKSTLARCIMALEDKVKGKVLYNNENILKFNKLRRRKLSKHIQLIFQNSRGALNNSYTAKELVKEPLIYNKLYTNKERDEIAAKWLNRVGITEEMHNATPQRLSTGQCQRVAIARALAIESKILVCDESISSLDVVIQEEILRLFHSLKEEYNLTIIMVSHDIRVLVNYCDRIAVMKDGVFIDVREGGDNFFNTDNKYINKLKDSVFEID